MRYFFSILGLMMIVGAGYFVVTQYVTVAHGQSGLIAVQNTGDVSANGAQVLALLTKLKALTLNGKIFQDPNFTTLQDWSVDIAPQTVGRPNPYLQSYGAVPTGTSTPKVALPKTK